MGAPLSREQQDWLKQLGTLVGAAPVALTEDQAGGGPKGRVRGVDKQALVEAAGAGNKEGLVGFGSTPSVKTSL